MASFPLREKASFPLREKASFTGLSARENLEAPIGRNVAKIMFHFGVIGLWNNTTILHNTGLFTWLSPI